MDEQEFYNPNTIDKSKVKTRTGGYNHRNSTYDEVPRVNPTEKFEKFGREIAGLTEDGKTVVNSRLERASIAESRYTKGKCITEEVVSDEE